MRATTYAGDQANALDVLIVTQTSSRKSAPYLLDAHGPRVVSYEELLVTVRSYQRQLSSVGIGSGSRVGLVLSEPLEFALWFMAGLAAGLWVAPLNPTTSSENLILLDDRARTLGVAVVLSDRPAPSGARVPWCNVAAGEIAGNAVTERLSTYDRRGGVLLSSSGTTGIPKVMALSLEQLLTNATLIVRSHQLNGDDRGFNPLPLWHVNAEVVGLLSTLVAGASLVVEERFHRTGFWKLIDDLEVTWINAVPAIVSRLSSLHDGECVPRRVRFIRSASAPLSPSLLQHFEWSTDIPIVQSYGMTEAASQICVNPLDGPKKPGSVGVALGAELRIAALEGAVLPATFDVGHIEIKGPTVIRSYESEEYADRFDADGWLRTGDLGYLDSDGYLFIVGRSDDVINRGGEKIYPLEIEDVLAGIDGVAAVGVIGEPDDVFGQVPVAYVQPTDATAIESPVAASAFSQSVRERVVTSLAKTHRPAKLRLVAVLPAHANGKIQKVLLREGDVNVFYEERM